MYKNILSLLFSLICSMGICQTKEGDAFIDVYYGFPDWQKYIMKNERSSYNYTNLSVTSTGHIGGRLEYLISKRIGFGLDLWYVQTNLSGKKIEYHYDYTNGYPQNQSRTFHDVKEKLSRLSLLGRFIVHIGNNKKIDPYVHAGFGYANYMYSYSSPKEVDTDSDNFFPLAGRAGFGLRVFLAEKLAANVDLGLGGPLFTLGLSYKISKASTE